MTERLRILIHLLGGQTMQAEVDSPLEADEYAEELRKGLTHFGRGFYTIGSIGFHTNALAGFDVDTL